MGAFCLAAVIMIYCAVFFVEPADVKRQAEEAELTAYVKTKGLI